MKVLHIEDEHIDQLAVERMIQQENLPYLLVSVNTISQAQSLLESDHFDVILSDYMLGAETAFDILPFVRDTPLVFVTGQGSEDIAVRAIKAGAYDYIIKDTQNDYLKMLPIVLDNSVKRKTAEIQAGKIHEERLRTEVLHQFIRDASHDLRTLLATIGTSLYLLDRYVAHLTKLLLSAPPEIQIELLNIQNRCDLLQNLNHNFEVFILNLLEMIRLDSLETFQFERCDLNTITGVAVKNYQDKALNQSVSLVFEPEAEPLWFNADAGEFGTVILHLLKNALSFTSAQGSVIVHTYATNDSIVLEVKDTGIGIATEEMDKIFQSLYRINKARTMDKGNGGIGLALIKRIVELHQGSIEVTSKLGEGSVFRVTLPKASN